MATSLFAVKSIRPRPIRAKAFTDEIKDAIRKEGQAYKSMLMRTVSTWTPKPTFRVHWRVRGGEASVEVSTTDARFKWINDGTRIRWAVMSRDWSSKSSPRTIGSRAGGGRVVIRGRQAMQQRNIKPRRGITARRFTQEISTRRRATFFKNMRLAMARGRRKAFG